MKTMKKSKFLIFFGIALAFVLSFSLLKISPSSVSLAEGEQNRDQIEINFVNSVDKILNGSEEYFSTIYYDKTAKKIEDESGTELNLSVSTTANSFNVWDIYNYAEESFAEIDDSVFGHNFSLKTLLQTLYEMEEKEEYIRDGKITLLSEKVGEGISTTLHIDDSVKEHGSLYLSGVKIKNDIVLNAGQEYSFKVVPDSYYELSSVGVYKPYALTSDFESDDVEFSYTTKPITSHTVKAVYEKIEYDINFLVVDRNYNLISDFETANYVDVLTTSGKVSESLGVIPTITSDNSFRFFKFEAFNVLDDKFEEVTLPESFVLSSDFIDKYAQDDQINVYVCFDELFEISVSFSGEGALLGYVDGGLISDSCYDQDSLIVYVSKYEEVLVYLLPDEGQMLANVSNVNNDELNGEIIVLESVEADREISVAFEQKHYTIQVYSYLDDGRTINGYEHFTKVYVDGVKSNKIVENQTITNLESTLSDDSEYQLKEYKIYNHSGNSWENFAYSKKITSAYVRPGEDVVYVKAIYSRLYKATVYVDALSEGAGYFDVEILNSDNTREERFRNITEFNEYLKSGMLVRVTAYSFAGYEFDSFTIKQTNLADPEIITKSIENEDVSIGIVFKKVNVPIKITSNSQHTKVESLTEESVSIGEKITISYKIDFSYELKNVYINNVRADKLDNVSVEDDSIVIDVTKTFLGSLDKDGTVSVKVQTKRDGAFISFIVVVPILLVLLLAGAVISVVVFVKTKKKHDQVEETEILK